jgi:hypothetical protein
VNYAAVSLFKCCVFAFECDFILQTIERKKADKDEKQSKRKPSSSKRKEQQEEEGEEEDEEEQDENNYLSGALGLVPSM